MISGRNSVGYEINSEFLDRFKLDLKDIKTTAQATNTKRIEDNIEFIKTYKKKGKDPKYKASNYEFSVITKQEIDLLFYSIKNYRENNNQFTVLYEKFEVE